MNKIRAIRNHVIFQFEDEQAKHQGVNQFKESTGWGFEYTKTTEGMESGRWVNVIAVGPDVPNEITPGMRVCVEKLMWTQSVEINGESYWRTDSDQILLVDDTK